MTVHRITELPTAQQQAVVLLVNRLASLRLPDEFVEVLLRRVANDAEQIMRFLIDEGLSRAIDKWLTENVPDMLDGTT
tara:strand:+ start:363 stop:596 length:234 start_codon:yes stop_codon:yes gene_type:complete